MSISLDSVTYSVKTAQEGAAVLNDISLEIGEGEFMGLMGLSGSGKTALLELISGLVRPEKGRVCIDGIDVQRLASGKKGKALRLGFLMQNSHKQFFQTSIERELTFQLRRLDISPEEREQRGRRAFEAMGFDWEKERKLSPLSLPLGAKRRLALACILAEEPEIIVLDEPFSYLDNREKMLVAEALLSLHSNGATLIMACNDADFLAEHAGRIIVMDKGRLIRDQRARELFTEYYYLLRHGLAVPKVRKAAQLLAEQGVNMPLNIISYEQFIDRLKIIMWRKEQ